MRHVIGEVVEWEGPPEHPVAVNLDEGEGEAPGQDLLVLVELRKDGLGLVVESRPESAAGEVVLGREGGAIRRRPASAQCAREQGESGAGRGLTVEAEVPEDELHQVRGDRPPLARGGLLDDSGVFVLRQRADEHRCGERCRQPLVPHREPESGRRDGHHARHAAGQRGEGVEHGRAGLRLEGGRLLELVHDQQSASVRKSERGQVGHAGGERGDAGHRAPRSAGAPDEPGGQQ